MGSTRNQQQQHIYDVYLLSFVAVWLRLKYKVVIIIIILFFFNFIIIIIIIIQPRPQLTEIYGIYYIPIHNLYHLFWELQ